MNKNNLLFLILFLLVGIFLYVIFSQSNLIDFNGSKNDSQSGFKTSIQSDFRLESKYLGNSKWTYTVTGQLPNPCYTADVEASVAESYPEQVTITVVIQEPEPDMMCAQIIQDFEYKGNFSASDKAEINLMVK